MRIYVVKGVYYYGELDLYVGTDRDVAEDVMMRDGDRMEIWEDGVYIDCVSRSEVEFLRNLPEKDRDAVLAAVRESDEDIAEIEDHHDEIDPRDLADLDYDWGIKNY